MGSLSTGGGSSAVAASAHAGCQRFRHTDPLVVGMSRRTIAAKLGHPDTSAGIPEARWMRAMTFERLVHNERFVSELLTTAVGALGLPRPTAVRRADGHVAIPTTAAAIQLAHTKAIADNVATMITSLAVPFVGMEAAADATPVKPDFAIVVPQAEGSDATWLILGDAKDYERVRSRIDDQRMLKGFLQVALGAESAAAWTALPDGMQVHDCGALAVPRNAFLQPEAVVERLHDHRLEVRARVDERTALLAKFGSSGLPEDQLTDFVRAIEAEFDPASCSTCSLFNYCRTELRASSDPRSLLAEIGVRREVRPAVIGLVDGTTPLGVAPETTVASITATVTGLPQWSGQRRTDPVGLPGTINVVLAKSDSAALGVHGIGVRRIVHSGKAKDWRFVTFAEPQAPATRTAVVRILGEEIAAAMAEAARLNADDPHPIHLVVPDIVTGDVLVSIADSLAGVETSRLRWDRDREMGRPALTFNGEDATIPAALTDAERLGVSFLLEEDRARAMQCRSPLVDLRGVLAQHLIPGGPSVDAGRLDYLVQWAEATTPLDHRVVADAIEAAIHTPGARLSNVTSDAIHHAGRPASRARSTRPAGDPVKYRTLVEAEIANKAAIVDRAIAVLDLLDASKLQPAYRALEAGAQRVWRRRVELHANDLVRFGRTSWVWRNGQVDMRDADIACADQLRALTNPQVAIDLAVDAGTRQVARATVTSVAPLELHVQSRRIVAGSTIVLLQMNRQPCIESPGVALKIQKGSFKLSGMAVGELTADASTDDTLRWHPNVVPPLAVDDELVVADATWFGKLLTSGHEINVDRPKADTNSAPKDTCDENTYVDDPDHHMYCCRPHELAEAAWADELAARRARGEMNPQTWPPVIDTDEFDTPAKNSPTADTEADPAATEPPANLTLDDLD